MDLTQTTLILFFNLVIALSGAFLFSIIIIILVSIKISLILENSKKILFVGFITLCVYDAFLLKTILINAFGISIISKLLFLIYGCICVYVLIYIKYELPLSFFSFCCFFCNFFIMFLYLYSCISISRLSTPILLKDLSYFSLYRHGLVLFVSLLVILVFIILKIIKVEITDSKLIKKILVPYLKEEVRLFVINSPIKDPLLEFANFIGRKIYEVNLARWFYFTISFFMNYFVGLLQNIFFCNFIFFHGDLRWNLYLIPLSFLAWIFKNFEYIFSTCLQDTMDYLLKVLEISWKHPDEAKDYAGKNFIQVDPNNLNYEITPYGIQEGFSPNFKQNGKNLADLLLENSTCCFYLITFHKRFKILKMFNFCFRVLCLVGMFFDFGSFGTYLNFGWGNSIFKISYKAFGSKTSSFMPQRTYATKVVKIKKESATDVVRETEGMYSPGHPLAIDSEIRDDRGYYLAENQFTHGKGPKDNPSKLLCGNKDVKGYARPQYSVFPKETQGPSFIPPESIAHVIPGSEKYCQRPDVRENIAKAAYKNWEEENT